MADVELTIKLKDEHVQRILAAVVSSAGEDIWFGIKKIPLSFKYDPKGEEETNRQFAKRWMMTLIRNFVRCSEFGADSERYDTERNAVVKPAHDVPDEIVE